MKTQKDQLRQSVRAQLIQWWQSDDGKAESLQLLLKMQDFFKSRTTGSWGFYKPLKHEWGTSDDHANKLMQSLPQVQWVFPVAEEKVWGSMVFKSEAGVEIKTSELSGLIVPGVLFDKDHHRLGLGRGNYDRCLKDFKGETVSVVSRHQWVSELPVESFDQKIKTLIRV